MNIKKYRANSIPEAVRMIKKDIGPGAMILSTRKLGSSRLNPFKQDMFEVTASSRKPDQDTDQDMYAVDNTDFMYDTTGKKNPAAWSGQNQGTFSADKLTAIEDDLDSLKEMFYISNGYQILPKICHNDSYYFSLYVKMIKAGITDHVSAYLINKTGALSAQPEHNPNIIKGNLVKEIRSSFTVCNPFEKKKKKYISAFIGPTGAGKTTTIAKLAAELSLSQKRSVGLISTDNYRIGACEHLKSYAAIMGIPCLSAFEHNDLKIAINQLRNKEVILIDTAGQSHLDLDRLREMEKVIGNDLSVTCHLVLSITGRVSDMREAARNFSILNPESYVFTKTDETRKRGNILDQILNMPLPISFVTNGQKVPEDIMPATKNNILKLIF